MEKRDLSLRLTGVWVVVITTFSLISGWLGITVSDLTPQLAARLGLLSLNGAFVINVYPGSPAQRGGVKHGDVVVSFNGEKILNAEALRNRLSGVSPGATIRLIVIREREERAITVLVGERPRDDV